MIVGVVLRINKHLTGDVVELEVQTAEAEIGFHHLDCLFKVSVVLDELFVKENVSYSASAEDGVGVGFGNRGEKGSQSLAVTVVMP